MIQLLVWRHLLWEKLARNRWFIAKKCCFLTSIFKRSRIAGQMIFWYNRGKDLNFIFTKFQSRRDSTLGVTLFFGGKNRRITGLGVFERRNPDLWSLPYPRNSKQLSWPRGARDQPRVFFSFFLLLISQLFLNRFSSFKRQTTLKITPESIRLF